jgi:hypothetical protein
MKRFLTCCAVALLPWLAQAGPMVNTVLNNGLFEPYGLTIDQANACYLTDSSHRVLKYDPNTGLLTALAGVKNAAGYTNGLGLFAQFYAPKGVAAFRGGLAVADSGNHLIRFVDNSRALSVVSNLVGFTNVQGAPTNGKAAEVHLNNPAALVTDGQNLFIADTKNGVIRRLDVNNYVTVIASGFNEPSGMALDPVSGTIYVSDTRNHAIKALIPAGTGTNTTYTVSHLAGSTSGEAGASDDLFAESARFNTPGGLLWAGASTGLIVADAGNNALRRIYQDADLNGYFASIGDTNIHWSVETYAGAMQQPGFQDGSVETSRFFIPEALAADQEGGWMIVDSGNNALRRIQIEEPRPQVQTPVIGYVTVVTNNYGLEVSKLIAFTNEVFNNDQTIAVLGELNTLFYTKGHTPGLSETDTIPVPNPGVTGEAAPPYFDDVAIDSVPASIVDSRTSDATDITIKVIGSEQGRRPSPVVQARLQFRTAPPQIVGDNPGTFQFKDYTVGAEIYYSIQGLITNSAGKPEVPRAYSPKTFIDGEYTSIDIDQPVTLYAQAFRNNYQPSEIVTKTFVPNQFSANRITLGFENGEASSQFVGAAGQWFALPVTLTLLPSAAMYSLQFNVTATNLAAAPSIQSNAFAFDSMLMKPIPNITPVVYEVIPPSMFVAPAFFTNMVFTNASENLLGVGWLERLTMTSLYDTTKQDLITYSMAHDHLYLSKDGEVIVGAYSFKIPLSAKSNDNYQVRIGRPSATSDGIAQDVYIDTPTNGSLGAGKINAIKNVVVQNPGYVVGDVAPFRWFNAGDFGDGSLLNNDVLQVFQSMWFTNASSSPFAPSGYGLNIPPTQSDFFAALDSCNGTQQPLDGNDASINTIVYGDGQLDVSDVFVTFRRSLDPNLSWIYRYWTNGVLNWTYATNNYRGKAGATPVTRVSASSSALPAEAAVIMQSTDKPAVRFIAGDFRAEPGQTVYVPIKAVIAGKYPIRVMMMSLNVMAMDGSPAIIDPVQFVPATGLGNPTYSSSATPSQYGAAWLDSSAIGVWGANDVGTLVIKIPSTATAQSAYKIAFAHISASPNGLGILPSQFEHGLVTLADRSGSSMNDGIPDQWRLRHFGTISNLLSAASADADGDGLTNLQEYRAGTSPVDPKSSLRLNGAKNAKDAPAAVTLHWPSVAGKTYVMEYSTSLMNPVWITLATGLQGTGWDMEYTDNTVSGEPRFYRVRTE